MAVKSTAWIMGMGAPLLAIAQARAEDSIGFAHESYVEDHARMTVQTETVRVHGTLSPSLDLTLRGVYDGISGATPVGAPAINQLTLRNPRTHSPIPSAAITGFIRPLDGISGASPATQVTPRFTVPLSQSHDIRRGVDVAPGLSWEENRFVPELSYSKEHDYISYAVAFNYSREMNEKNTTLNVGWAHSYDQVLSNQFTYLKHRASKNSDDLILGVSQLLGPGTIFSANGTFSHEAGYLNDPYRSVVFDETNLDANARVILDGEKRPSSRDSQALLLSLTQAVPALNASVEGTYRYYHDSYDIMANTFGLAWFQKFATTLVVSPSFRYYRQDAARFYAIQFPGDPANDPGRAPRYYSSDYRLSSLQTFTLGLEANIKLHEQWDFHLGYQRYWMRGLDHKTLQVTYPSANIFTVGLSFNY